MHTSLRQLARQRWKGRGRYGLTVGVVGLATLIGLVAPFDTAPFLLDLTNIFFVVLAFGRTQGVVGLAVSGLLAAYFFLYDTMSRGSRPAR